MSTKLPWTRLFADKWLLDLACLPAIEGNVYMRLRLQMLRTREPLVNDAQILSHFTCCSVKRFHKALDYLFRSGHIVLSEDGDLWCPDVEEELKNSDETLNKFAERAQKAANTRKHKNQEDSSRMLQDSSRSLEDSSRCLQDSSRGYINTNNNIYNKKTNTIVLAKKEIDFENLETEDHDHDLTEVRDCESQPEQIATVSENQPPIHEQENVSQKAKRSRSDRGCRLPEDFEPNLQYAIDQGLTHDETLFECERFKNFWLAKSGKDATKTDWQRTWYNWVTNQNGTLAKKKEKEKQAGGNNERFSKNQRTSGGTGEAIRNLIGATQLSDTSTRYRATDGAICNSRIPMDLERWHSIDASPRETSFRSLSNGSKFTCLESIC